MDITAMQLLHDFARACPRVSFDEDAWQHLYRFTLDNHRRALSIDKRTVRDYLVKHGCSLQKASWVCSHYQHFTELLTLYDQQPASPTTPHVK
jgi:hypothetical protein